MTKLEKWVRLYLPELNEVQVKLLLNKIEEAKIDGEIRGMKEAQNIYKGATG